MSLANQIRKALATAYAKIDALTGDNPVINRGAANAGTEQLMAAINNDRSPFCVGRVTFAHPLDFRYTVSLGAPKNKIIECIDLQGSGAPFAVKTARIFPPQTTVFVYWENDVLVPGIILGAVSDAGDRYLRKRPVNPINQNEIGSPAVSDVQRVMYDKLAGLYYGDLRSLDSLAIGELSFETVFGNMIHADPFQLFIRAADDCGIWLHEFDRLLRIISKTYQHWTPASSEEIYCDHDETSLYKGISPNSWETFGLFKRPKDDTKELKTGIPFFRVEQFGGWMGQGGLRQVKSLPWTGAETNTVNENTYAKIKSVPTQVLFRESIGLDGTYSLKSAGAVFIERQSAIPAFNRIADADNPKGDGNDGIPVKAENKTEKPFEFLGNSKDRPVKLKHKATKIKKSVRGGLQYPDTVTRAEYAALYPFIKHEKDFEKVEAARIQNDVSGLDPKKLKTQQFQEDLKYAALPLGDPIGSPEYAVGRQGIYLLPDGGIVIKDVFGNEIRTGAGGIEFLSAADINIRPDRRAVVMAGDDIILTANKSLDITAAQDDVRFAAFKNMEMVSGIGGKGRMVIENKGASFIPSADDPTKGTFSTSIHTDEAIGEDIGTSGILIIAKSAYVATYGQLAYTDAKISVQNNDAFYVKSNVTHISATSQAGIFAGQLITAVSVFATTSEPKKASAPSSRPVADFFSKYIDGEGQLGNSDAVAAMGFSFRNMDQYGTEEYVFIAPSHQMTMEHPGNKKPLASVVNYFGLNFIYSTIEDDMSGPFPGKKQWYNEEAYLTAHNLLFDVNQATPKLDIKTNSETEFYGEPYKTAPRKSYSATVIERKED